MVEQNLVAMLLKKDTYDACRDYIQLHTFESGLKKVVKIIDKLYTGDEVKEIHMGDIKTLLISEYPSMKDDEKELIFGMLTSVYNINTDSVASKEVIRLHKNKVIAGQLGEMHIKFVDNPGDFAIEEVKKLCSKYEDTADEEEVEFDDFTLDELLESESDASGFTWPWEWFNKKVGRLKGGILMLLFAYPNQGKSAMLHTMSTHFATQTKVLVINNEERKEKVGYRARSCWCEMTLGEMRDDPQTFNERWDIIKDNWILKQDKKITIPNIRKYIRASGAKIVLIDQAVKIKVSKNERKDAELTDIFEKLRAEVQDEFPDVNIIGIGRGDLASKTAKKIGMEHLADCKSGVQGELDIMMGMNRPDDGNYMNIFLCKAKETGAEGEETVLELDRCISKVKEIKQ